MKVAVVTDDGKTISQHFGRARFYMVYEIKDSVVVGSEQRPKAGHHVAGAEPHHEHGVGPHGQNHVDEATHTNMLANITDCEVLIARGMGWGAHDAIERAGLKPFITDTASIDEAVKAYVAGKLDNHAERLH